MQQWHRQDAGKTIQEADAGSDQEVQQAFAKCRRDSSHNMDTAQGTMNTSIEQDRWDVFISHASEDKLMVAMPVAQEIERMGLAVWLDMNMTTSVDSFDKFKLLRGVIHESTSTKGYFTKLKVFEHVARSRNVAFTCRYFGISRETYYQWKRAYQAQGEEGLINSKPCTENPKLRTPPFIEEKIIYLRRTYHFGQMRISGYLARYHDIKISAGGVYNVLKRRGLNRLPDRQRKRSIPTIRYEKQVPGHHVQVDVKFLDLKAEDGRKVRYFQYTAIDDATRIRAL